MVDHYNTIKEAFEGQKPSEGQKISWKMRSRRVLVMRPVLLTELSSLARAQSNCSACLDRTTTPASSFCSAARE
ncbi:hypothetical protein EYF80_025435 [Liparis tanakae]|uniref:Uncharacterized protein n=1 Tax=Liparis tanakae TaxID=230148 RepID=A0A4Z2HGE3_9TELE|nr:hypothetical protein EYF80_025435 [Liparis tanakae]